MQRPYILYLNYPSKSDNHLRKLAGIRRYASERGWDVTTLSRKETSRDAVKALCAGTSGTSRPVGCIAEALVERHDLLPPSLFANVPIVYLDPPGPLPWRGAVAVTCDNAAVAASAYDELSAGMPQCYAAVSSGSTLRWNRERIEAFRARCAADGHKLRVFPDCRGKHEAERSTRLVAWLAALPRHSAVFATNDVAARDVAEAARAIPRHIPKELTVLGVDGKPDAENRGTFHAVGERPGLSSVKLDFELAGYLAAKTLAEVITRGEADFRSFGPLCILRRESTRGGGRRDPSVLKAVETIRREACDGLTAAALAARFPGSRKNFERRFREAMGHSVLDEILHIRLEKAQSLLMRRDVPIADIAGLCGFRTAIELRKLFRLRFHTSMRQWRHEHAPEDLI